MPDTDRHITTQTLQNEARPIARGAAAIFFGRLNELTASGERPPVPFRAADGHGLMPDNPPSDEAIQMVLDGFVHLNGVMSLAVLVDESGLISEELDWLKHMLGARQMNFDYARLFDILLQSYLQTCQSFLDGPQLKLVEEAIVRAKATRDEAPLEAK